jgi:hypothetical protein
LAKFYGDVSQDEGQVNRENQELAHEQVVKLHVYDNTKLHIEGHTEWQRSAGYQALPPMAKNLTELHVREHREHLLAQLKPEGPPQQQEQQQQQEQAQEHEQEMQHGQEDHEQQAGQSEEQHAQQMQHGEEDHEQKQGQQAVQAAVKLRQIGQQTPPPQNMPEATR